MDERLQNQKRRKYLGVKGLSAAAEQFLEEIGHDQTKGTVSEYPSERTIRFYLSEELLPPPDAKQGLSSVFGYRHLITLLLIKKLQSQRLPVSAIKSFLAGKSVTNLEKLLNERIEIFTDSAALASFIKTSGMEEGEQVVVLNDANVRNEYLEASKSEKVSNDLLESNDFEKWTRVQLTDGLELHISSNFRVPVTESKRQLVLKKIDLILKN